MRAWIQHHRLSLAQTAGRLAQSPFATALNIVAIGVALALPFGVYCLLANVKALSHKISFEPELTVFLARDATKADVAAIESRLKGASGVRTVRFIPREAALADLGRTGGLSEVIASLPRNPLPDAFVVTLSASDPASAGRLESEFKSVAKVAHVQADQAWVKRLDALLSVGRTGLLMLAVVLGMALVAVTFNTIRLQILTQRDEIELCRLIGATHSYIRRPFFYLGSLLGFLGGLAALGIVIGGLVLLNGDLGVLAQLYGSDLRLSLPTPQEMGTVLGIAAALGWLGAYLSVSRHLHRRFGE